MAVSPVGLVGFLLREVPGRGVAAFAARDFAAGDVVFEEEALVLSAVAVVAKDEAKSNRKLWEALAREERSRRLPTFEPVEHLGALVALRDLGADGCRAKLLTMCCDGELPSPKEAKREVEVLRSMVRCGLVPQGLATFPPGEYAKLRLIVKLNGFKFNGELCEGEPGYDIGEALFDNVCRINHSCDPNLEFDPRWSEEHGNVVNRVTATSDIAAGCELHISYLPLRLNQPVAERRSQLRVHWGFDCDCVRCMAEGGPPPAPSLPRPVVATEAGGATVGGKAADESRAARDGHAAGDGSSSEEGICWDDLKDPDEAI